MTENQVGDIISLDARRNGRASLVTSSNQDADSAAAETFPRQRRYSLVSSVQFWDDH